MKLTPCDIKEIGKVQYFTKTKNLRLLEEFINSDMDCARIDYSDYKSKVSCVNSITRSIKRFHMTEVKVIVRGNNIYLVKASALEKLKGERDNYEPQTEA